MIGGREHTQKRMKNVHSKILTAFFFCFSRIKFNWGMVKNIKAYAAKYQYAPVQIGKQALMSPFIPTDPGLAK